MWGKSLRLFAMAAVLSGVLTLIGCLSLSADTVLVPMRDGTKLATDVYLPPGKGPWPAVVVRTPYEREPLSDSAIFSPVLVVDGYAVVVQSLRGRFGSEGGGEILFMDDGWGAAQDGYDCVEWVAKQEWCNGKVGVIGSSGPGIASYLMAGASPPHLKCQIVGMAACDLYGQAIYQGGALRKEQVEGWLSQNSMSAINLKTISGHVAYDSLWQEMDLRRRFSNVDIPVLHVGGWYDTFQDGTITAFVGLQSMGGKGARGRQRLVIGPWSHTDFDRVGEFVYPNNTPENFSTYLGWFDYWLKGKENGVSHLPAVAYYTMGAVGEKGAPGNEWRSSDVWPIPASITPYYLNEGGSLSRAKPKAPSRGISYRFDPVNPVPTLGGNNLFLAKGPMDQRKIDNRSDILSFTTPALAEPIEVTGRVKAELWVRSSATDTDFTAKLIDVYPDGRRMLVADGIIRARYRDSLSKPELMSPGTIYRVVIDLWSTSLVFNKGHRVGLSISSSNSPRFDVNPNTGGYASGTKEKVVVTNTVYLDAEHPSAVFLPVIHPTNKQ